MVKKNKQSSFNLSFLFKSSVVINLLYLFIVLLLIKMIDGFVDGFSNPQLLQREYYYFYPELFQELPGNMKSSMKNEINELDGVQDDKNKWLPSNDEDMKLMGSDETETPYLMEELYLIQDDVRDLKTQQEIIKNDLSIPDNSATQCTSYEASDIDPCNNYSIENNLIQEINSMTTNPDADAQTVSSLNIITNEGLKEYCTNSDFCKLQTPPEGTEPVSLEYDITIIGDETETTMNEQINDPAICVRKSEEDVNCSELYNNNGGLLRSSCPWICKYTREGEQPLQGSLLLNQMNINP